MIKSLLLFCLSLYPLSSVAENIVEIDRGNTPGRVYIDMDSLVWDGDIVEFWYILDVYSSHRKKGTKVYGHHELKPLKYYRSNKVKLAINCATNKQRYLKVKAYDQAAGKGPLVGSHRVKNNLSKWEKVIKGSTTSLLYPHVCSGR